MCSIPIASVKDTNGIGAEVGEGLEEADEAMLVVDLTIAARLAQGDANGGHGMMHL